MCYSVYLCILTYLFIVNRGHLTDEEIKFILLHVNSNGTTNWAWIAQELMHRFYQPVLTPKRTRQQCKNFVNNRNRSIKLAAIRLQNQYQRSGNKSHLGYILND